MPRHIGHGAEAGDFASRCDYCMEPRLRSELTRDAQGLLRCEFEDGREPMELDQANAAAAANQLQPAMNDGGRFPREDTAGVVTLETLLEGTL